MLKIIRKADIVLFVLLLLLGVGLSLPSFIKGTSTPENATVEITVAGELYGSYPLNKDTEINVSDKGHLNKVIIKDGQVQMIEASCHNQLCIKQGTIGMPNQQIICLPNRVVVRIVSDQGGDVDVISG